ncbi:MAG: hypothetical protein LBT47_08900 [Deltaproteobacteria bacterium]|jgi:hypothetical protein|nr:hypothetical protein [Deltaproteobacteria bacterium]
MMMDDRKTAVYSSKRNSAFFLRWTLYAQVSVSGISELNVRTAMSRFLAVTNTIRRADFWSWAYSDLVGNTECGKLAEFIVSLVMNCSDGVSEAWGAFDVLSPEGTKIEVKTSAYLQSWAQTTVSDIRFGVRKTLVWDYAVKEYTKQVMRQADVYVFCVENFKEQELLNQLDLSQWEFYPMATKTLNETIAKQKTVGLITLIAQGAKKCTFNE